MIHPTAIIDPSAELAADVEVGPHVVIDGAATVARGCRIEAGAQLVGTVEIGANTVIGRAAIIGAEPQDFGYRPELKSGVRIGERNVIREHVTIHRSSKDGGFTLVGDDNFLMVGTHIGHDSRVGDHNAIANGCLIGGHVTIGDYTFLGGGAGFHQFARVGDYAMAQGNGGFSKDMPPYCTCAKLNCLIGLNVIGLRRAGFTPAERKELKTLFTLLFKKGVNLSLGIEKARQSSWSPTAERLLSFVESGSKLGICALE